MKASDHIAQALADRGVTHVFEMIGGMITHLVDSIAKGGRIRLISMHHEQGAAFAVDGHARLTGIPAVALATSGPGATNLITGIGSCYFDSVPAVFITGQVNRHELKGQRAIRQLGFQETDIVPMVVPITKAAWRVDDPAQLPAMLRAAFELAVAGRPGPVLLDIPMDVQRADIPAPTVPTPTTSGPVDASALALAWDALAQAERPLLLIGGGIRSALAQPTLLRCLSAAEVPVVHSLMGTDCLASDHRSRLGLIGSYGNRWANLAIAEADVLLVLGSRLDIRQTGGDVASFRGTKRIIHVDCEPGEVNNRIAGCTAIIAHLRDFLERSADHLARRRIAAPAAWRARLEDLRQAHPDVSECAVPDGSIQPNRFIHQLSRASGRAASVCIDVGQHQMWAAQSWEIAEGQRFLTSGGMGSMGFALPAAIGAACATPGRPVVLVAGDGVFQCNIQELQTVRRLGLPLKLVVINNRCHGMVRQFQESYFDSRYQSTVDGYSTPDFTAVATAYGLPARHLADPAGIDEALAWLWRDPTSPALLEVALPTAVNVYPKLAFGRRFPDMEPDVRPVEMEGT